MSLLKHGLAPEGRVVRRNANGHLRRANRASGISAVPICAPRSDRRMESALSHKIYCVPRDPPVPAPVIALKINVERPLTRHTDLRIRGQGFGLPGSPPETSENPHLAARVGIVFRHKPVLQQVVLAGFVPAGARPREILRILRRARPPVRQLAKRQAGNNVYGNGRSPRTPARTYAGRRRRKGSPRTGRVRRQAVQRQGP